MTDLTEKQFLRDIGNHKITIIRDDGVYRHVRFAQPDTNNMFFDLITWPGFLCYCGDMGTFVFERLEDMFCFFRNEMAPRDDGRTLFINTGYWAEKCQAADDCNGIYEYSPELFCKIVKEIVDNDEDATKDLREQIEEEVLNYADDGEYAARQAAGNFKFKGESYFHDFWENTLTVNSRRFVWCCYALSWGIKAYDSAKLKNI